MSHHTTEIQYTDTAHRYGQLYKSSEPAVYVSFTVSRMNNRVTFKHNGSANHWPHQTWIGAARRLLGSTAGIDYTSSSNLYGGHNKLITVYRGAK